MIAIGCDHGGINLKNTLIQYLKEKGYSYKDFGTHTKESCDYPDIALEVTKSIKSGESELGVLICGTGIGMSITANKVEGIRAALCHDVFSAKATRSHNDTNVLCCGERVIGSGLFLEIVEAFLNSSFEGGRHSIRVNKIAEIEKANKS